MNLYRLLVNVLTNDCR